ncbi:MAG: SIR2 family protein [Acinetobacter sp.]|uniref:SIR2 family protein n=1 Tax=Acinetobacter sp. TaxID=472 RepID=UPI003981D0A8
MKNFKDVLKSVETNNTSLLESILKLMQTGNGLLFLGAGFSRQAININNCEFKLAKSLSHDICELGNFEKSDALDYATDFFLENNSKESLIDFLRTEFSVKEIQESHKKICEFDWLRIYTTNYDEVIETAYKIHQKDIQAVDIDTEAKLYLQRKNLCIHLNGYISNLNATTLEKSFKLSLSSYLDPNSFLNSDWGYIFQKDIERCSILLFIGYSLYDLDIQRVLKNQSEDIQNKTYFIVHESISREEEHKLKKFGTVLKIGFEGFYEFIKSKNIIKNNSNIDLFCFNKLQYNPNITPIKAKDSDIEKLLINGILDEKLIPLPSEKNKDNFYLIERQAIKDIKDLIHSKDPIFISSKLGNGKTCLLRTLALELTTNYGYECYELKNVDQNIYKEIDYLLKVRSKELKCCILIDNYTQQNEIIKYINLHRSDDTKLFLFDRTSKHENSDFYNSGYHLMIDKLNESEIRKFVSIFTHLGAWGKKSSYSESRKVRYFKEDLEAELSMILLELLKSPNIQSKIENNILNLKQQDEKNHINIILICLLQSLNITPTQSFICKMSNSNKIYDSTFTKSENFKSVFGDYKQVKNSVLYNFILKNYFPASEVTNSLILIIKNLKDLRGSWDFDEKELYKALIRFSFIERILSENVKIETLRTYYEELKYEIPGLKNDPQFWLQYAMCYIAHKDYPKADQLLNTAYGLAEASYNTHKIDNQKARLLLLQINDNNSIQDNFEKYREASTLILNQPSNDFKIRRISDLYEITNKYYYSFSTSQKNILNPIILKVIGSLNEIKSFNYKKDQILNDFLKIRID